MVHTVAPSSHDCDVLIVGAGPAGCAAALKLAQLGVRDIVLVDLHDFPRHKVCGSGLSRRALLLLDELGVWENLKPMAYPITGMRVVSSAGHEAYFSGDDSNNAAICSRYRMDHALWQSALDLGVRFLAKFKAVSPLTAQGQSSDDGGHQRWLGVRAADGREIRARQVVVANGANSALAMPAGKSGTMHTIMGWWEGVAHRPHTVELIWDDLLLPCYGWLFPEGAGRVNIGITYDDPYKQKHAKKLFRTFLRRSMANRLDGARQIDKLRGHPIVYSYEAERRWSPGRIIVGEAGRMTNPATGEGIYQGLQSGIFAAEALVDVLRGRRSEREACIRYERRCSKLFLPGFWLGGAFRELLRTPLFDAMVRVSGHARVRGAVTRVFETL